MIKPLTVPPKKLAQSILSTDTSFILNNIIGWDGNDLTTADFGTTCFAVFKNSTNTLIEIVEIDVSTIASPSISILNRGLSFDGTSNVIIANALDWSANDTSVMLGTDAPQLWMALKDYIDGIAIAGAPNATTSLQGLVELGTQAEIDAGTGTGGTGASLAVTPDKLRAKKYSDYIADAGSNDSYAITVVPAITAYAAGQEFTFKANTANTGAATLNVCGLGAKTIKKNVTEDLNDGEIAANQIVKVVYDASGNFQLVSDRQSIAPIVIVYTTPGGNTWTKPAGLKYISVEVLGGGANGTTGGGSSSARGGGSGGYAKKFVIPAALLGSTETATVGAASTSSTFTVTSGSTITGGGASTVTGGTASNGDINIPGQNAQPVDSMSTGGNPQAGSSGGNTLYGQGGVGVGTGSGGDGYGYGSGGAGGGNGSQPGGIGKPGIIIVTEHYS